MSYYRGVAHSGKKHTPATVISNRFKAYTTASFVQDKSAFPGQLGPPKCIPYCPRSPKLVITDIHTNDRQLPISSSSFGVKLADDVMWRALGYLTLSEIAGLRLVSTTYSELIWEQFAMVFEYRRCWCEKALQNAPRVLQLF